MLVDRLLQEYAERRVAVDPRLERLTQRESDVLNWAMSLPMDRSAARTQTALDGGQVAPAPDQ